MNHPIKRVEFVRKYLDGIFAEDVHAKRVMSLANGAVGVMTGASLAVSIIGQSLAQARGLLSKHAIKQVDRLLSNQGIIVWDMFAPWVAEMVGQRTSIVVAMDWTDFDADDQATLALSLVTNHGRATPLLWLSVLKDELKDQRNDFEDLCLARLARVLPEGVAVTILADRGFGDTKLFDFLDTLGFAYVIRFRGNIHVSATDGETRPAAAWVGKGGRARKLRDAAITAVHRADAARRAARGVNFGQNAQLVPRLEGAPTGAGQKFGRSRCWPRDDRRPTAFLNRGASSGKSLFMIQDEHNHRML